MASSKVLIMAAISKEAINELTTKALLRRNVNVIVFYQQELSPLCQAQKKGK